MKHDADDVKAQYFLGLAAEQDGRREDAAMIWQRLLAGAPADPPWAGIVRSALARVQGEPVRDAPGPNVDDMAAALAPEERNAMVRGMVARLATRLAQNGADADGWLQLMRAYAVLGETDEAKAVAADARRALASDAENLRRIDALAKTLELGS